MKKKITQFLSATAAGNKFLFSLWYCKKYGTKTIQDQAP